MMDLLDIIIVTLGVIFGAGVFRWGFYRGRQWERAVGDDSPMRMVPVYYPPPSPPPAPARLVPIQGESPSRWGPRYIVDEHGRLFEINRVDVAKCIGYVKDVEEGGEDFYKNWKCVVCGNIERGNQQWCLGCGHMRDPDSPMFPLPKWIERGDHH
jgi:hypothetical protein